MRMTFDSAGNEAIPNPEMMGNDRNNDDKFSHVLVMFPDATCNIAIAMTLE